jgi:hypothetical protein
LFCVDWLVVNEQHCIVYVTSSGKFERKRPYGTPKSRWEDIFKNDLEEIEL